MVKGVAILLAAVAVGSGCSKAEESGGSPLLQAWAKAGLTVSAFTDDKSKAIGATCKSGTVSGVDVVLCSFTNEAEAKAAEAKGLEWVGAATGTTLTKGKELLAVVDRRKSDPSGRTINAITKAFRK